MNERAGFPRVLCLAGPTGAGKTALAIHLADKFNGEILNADSRQVYADFPILTAQPTAAELREAPHHLYGTLPAEKKLSACEWAAMAASKSRELEARGKLPLLVGGTGFYFEALLKGLSPMPDIPDQITIELSQELLHYGLARLYAELLEVDPVYAAHIHPNDQQRVLRAVAVHRASGHPFTWWHQQKRQPLAAGKLLSLDVSLTWLTPRLEKRIDQMVEMGAIEEVAKARHHYPQMPKAGFSSLGCMEIIDYLDGKCTFENCRQKWLHTTRSYAKRQLTWFRGRGTATQLPYANPSELLQQVADILDS